MTAATASTFQALAAATPLKVLPDHIHVILGAALAWHFIYRLGYRLSEWSGNKHFAALSPIKRVDWGLHITSSVHAVLISILAWKVFGDPVLQEDKLFAYTPYAGNVYAIACGYFLWDTLICLYYLKHFGFGFAIHGIACLVVFGLCFRPFLLYYGAVFLFFELSTPFLNIHWFCDKTGRTGSTLQAINGVILLAVFFAARICFGFYQSGDFFVSMLRRKDEVPIAFMATYSVANVVLNGLNVFWFVKMISAITRRFSKSSSSKRVRNKSE
ncbi:hypothetical protein HDU85_004468 [Gaertneriomyces sp. JEL0708]|nr:hypothetical protein HDU85_004468 [Gaertneriomyces sp. JEL0708]